MPPATRLVSVAFILAIVAPTAASHASTQEVGDPSRVDFQGRVIDGAFLFPRLPLGSYAMMVTKLGYQVVDARFDAGGSDSLRIILEPSVGEAIAIGGGSAAASSSTVRTGESPAPRYPSRTSISARSPAREDPSSSGTSLPGSILSG